MGKKKGETETEMMRCRGVARQGPRNDTAPGQFGQKTNSSAHKEVSAQADTEGPKWGQRSLDHALFCASWST